MGVAVVAYTCTSRFGVRVFHSQKIRSTTIEPSDGSEVAKPGELVYDCKDTEN